MVSIVKFKNKSIQGVQIGFNNSVNIYYNMLINCVTSVGKYLILNLKPVCTFFILFVNDAIFKPILKMFFVF